MSRLYSYCLLLFRFWLSRLDMDFDHVNGLTNLFFDHQMKCTPNEASMQFQEYSLWFSTILVINLIRCFCCPLLSLLFLLLLVVGTIHGGHMHGAVGSSLTIIAITQHKLLRYKI